MESLRSLTELIQGPITLQCNLLFHIVQQLKLKLYGVLIHFS